jgi:hypothetical protein
MSTPLHDFPIDAKGEVDFDVEKTISSKEEVYDATYVADPVAEKKYVQLSIAIALISLT